MKLKSEAATLFSRIPNAIVNEQQFGVYCTVDCGHDEFYIIRLSTFKTPELVIQLTNGKGMHLCVINGQYISSFEELKAVLAGCIRLTKDFPGVFLR